MVAIQAVQIGASSDHVSCMYGAAAVAFVWPLYVYIRSGIFEDPDGASSLSFESRGDDSLPQAAHDGHDGGSDGRTADAELGGHHRPAGRFVQAGECGQAPRRAQPGLYFGTLPSPGPCQDSRASAAANALLLLSLLQNGQLGMAPPHPTDGERMTGVSHRLRKSLCYTLPVYSVGCAVCTRSRFAC